jgi:hypothetical protein
MILTSLTAAVVSVVIPICVAVLVSSAAAYFERLSTQSQCIVHCCYDEVPQLLQPACCSMYSCIALALLSRYTAHLHNIHTLQGESTA